MLFPTTGQLIGHHNLMLVAGPILLLLSALAFYTSNQSKHRTNIDFTTIQPFGMGLVLVLLGAVFTFALIAGLSQSLRARVDLAQIAAIRVSALDEEGEVVGKPHILTGAQLRDGMQTLTLARNYPYSPKARLSNGYLIELQLIGEREFGPHALTVYRTSRMPRDPDDGHTVAVVIPRLIPDPQWAGTYDAPEFHAWIRRAIDPLFASP